MRAAAANAGFVLPVVLGIILLAGLFAVQATGEAGGTTMLATQRQLQQRAFEAAESGVIAVVDQLGAGAEPAALQTLRSAGANADSSSVTTTITARLTLPDGFSAGRVAETEYQIQSQGHSVRGSNITVVQGARQLRVVAP